MTEIHVLAIHDEKICVEDLKEAINWEGLGIGPKAVAGAYSVRQAQNYVKDNPVHIIICDVEMPGKNGLDFIEWITEWARFTSEPMECIMLTCHPEYEFVRRGLQLGCLDYVLKPMNPEEMEQVLAKAVSRIREREKKEQRTARVESTEVCPGIVYGKIIPYIEANLTKSISVEMIADYVSLNPQYMMRMFKKETGESILVYVTNRRMEMAKEMLLKTDWPIERITEQVGYFSTAHFGKLFKKLEGISPGQYRKEHR